MVKALTQSLQEALLQQRTFTWARVEVRFMQRVFCPLWITHRGERDKLGVIWAL